MVFYCCIGAGVPLGGFVLFVDRGYARNAFIRMDSDDRPNGKYCSRHILWNIYSFMGINESDSRCGKAVYILQSSNSRYEYLEAATAIGEEFGPRGVEYLCVNIHPVNWCVFANLPLENSVPLPSWVGSKDIYLGTPDRLWNVRSTNSAEGENNALQGGIRVVVSVFDLPILTRISPMYLPSCQS